MIEEIGTPPDGRMFFARKIPFTQSTLGEAFGEYSAEHPDQKWHRLTVVEGGFWVEGWAMKPELENLPPTKPQQVIL